MFNRAHKEELENNREISADESLEFALKIVEAAADRDRKSVV